MFEDFFFSLISILNPKYVNEDKIHFYLYNMTIFKLLPLVLFLLTLSIYSPYKKMYKIVFRRIGYFLQILRFYIVLPLLTDWVDRAIEPEHRVGPFPEQFVRPRLVRRGPLVAAMLTGGRPRPVAARPGPLVAAFLHCSAAAAAIMRPSPRRCRTVITWSTYCITRVDSDGGAALLRNNSYCNSYAVPARHWVAGRRSTVFVVFVGFARDDLGFFRTRVRALGEVRRVG